MRRTVEERARLYGWSAQELIEHDERVRAEVATWPELGEDQKAVIRTLMGTRTIPPRPAPAPKPAEQPEKPKRRRRTPAPRSTPDMTAAAPATGTAA